MNSALRNPYSELAPHDAVKHLVGRSYRSIGDCWEFSGTVLSIFGIPWHWQPIKHGAARHGKYFEKWHSDYQRHDRPAFGRVIILRWPKNRRVNGYPFRWHCGVMLDNRWFIHASAQGVIKSRIDDPSFGPFVNGYYTYDPGDSPTVNREP